MSKSFVRHGSTKVPVYGRGLCLLYYVVSDTFLGKITMSKYVRKIWKKLVRAEKLRIENKDEGIPITALREMCILKHLHHENVVELYEIIQDVDKIVLIFEYADMDLKMYIDKVNGIKDVKIIQVSLSTFYNI